MDWWEEPSIKSQRKHKTKEWEDYRTVVDWLLRPEIDETEDSKIVLADLPIHLNSNVIWYNVFFFEISTTESETKLRSKSEIQLPSNRTRFPTNKIPFQTNRTQLRSKTKCKCNNPENLIFSITNKDLIQCCIDSCLVSGGWCQNVITDLFLPFIIMKMCSKTAPNKVIGSEWGYLYSRAEFLSLNIWAIHGTTSGTWTWVHAMWMTSYGRNSLKVHKTLMVYPI